MLHCETCICLFSINASYLGRTIITAIRGRSTSCFLLHLPRECEFINIMFLQQFSGSEQSKRREDAK